jgi:hypothetical protein
VEVNVKSRPSVGIVLLAGIIGLTVLVAAGYFIWKAFQVDELKPKEAQTSQLPRMANLPPKKEVIPTPPPPSYTPDAPVLEKARKALREGITPEAALALANSLPDSPERVDAAFLLLEFAADSGNAEAALAVARYYDPTEALEGGQKNAEPRLAQLRSWVEERANQGSYEARELLNAWR